MSPGPGAAVREARRTREGKWYIQDGSGELCRIGQPDWSQDEHGHWPLVELEVRDFGAEVRCPNCTTPWILEEMDCVFGTACREGNDLWVLVRCTRCRLPHCVRAVGFVTAHPRVVELMAGWSRWERRLTDFVEAERRFYGAPRPR